MSDDKPFSDIIDAIGVPALAQLFGLPESHIRTMKARNSIPPEYWGQVIDAAPHHGIANLSHERMRAWRNGRFARARVPATSERAAS
ncbi:hypothetical protein [Rhodoplanes serenus]|uniref:hypothetical protein n=1 Tax=Rhodoplanes serenus TaxID=200615 RepID=UPI000DADBF93|nr:hypothetical protein [Rhodoplanes serenus]RAI28742.1 hypothetical protein CH340_23355 [Rhodoplanes serenus]